MAKKAAKITTLKQLASHGFEPWTRQDGEPDKLKAALKVHTATLLIAFDIMHKSKPELAQAPEKHGDDVFMKFANDLGATADYFRDMAKVLEAAECRLISAGASVVVL